jgi:hypothetical protein
LLPLVLAGWLFPAACSQAPIFYYISNEYEPKEPMISGGPSKIVEFDGMPHVSNGKIYRYTGTASVRGVWEPLPEQVPIVKDIAVTDTYLYALSVPGVNLDSAVLYRKGKGPDAKWESVAAGPIQAIYGAGTYLFAGMGDSQNNALYYMNDTAQTLTLLREFSYQGELRGAAAADNFYFVATTGQGIYAAGDPGDLKDAAPLLHSLDAGQISGLYHIEGTDSTGTAASAVIAVSGAGKIWRAKSQASGPVGELIGEYDGLFFTGAAAVWEKKLLLLGIRSGSGVYTYGYREFPLDKVLTETSAGSPVTPGESSGDSSVDNYAKYSTSLGKHVVNSLYQAKDGLLFASTQKNGLWAYRNDEWNAEE